MANETDNRGSHLIHETDQTGQVIIADEVFMHIAALAALEVEGVDSLAGHISREQIAKKSLSKGVKVKISGDEVEIYLSLNIDFGHSIPSTSARVQERVQSAVESMIGYNVKRVNIKIAGVVAEK